MMAMTRTWLSLLLVVCAGDGFLTPSIRRHHRGMPLSSSTTAGRSNSMHGVAPITSTTTGSGWCAEKSSTSSSRYYYNNPLPFLSTASPSSSSSRRHHHNSLVWLSAAARRGGGMNGPDFMGADNSRDGGNEDENAFGNAEGGPAYEEEEIEPEDGSTIKENIFNEDGEAVDLDDDDDDYGDFEEDEELSEDDSTYRASASVSEDDEGDENDDIDKQEDKTKRKTQRRPKASIVEEEYEEEEFEYEDDEYEDDEYDEEEEEAMLLEQEELEEKDLTQVNLETLATKYLQQADEENEESYVHEEQEYVPLQDSTQDPSYTKTKRRLEAKVEATKKRLLEQRANRNDEDAMVLDFILGETRPESKDLADKFPLRQDLLTPPMELTEEEQAEVEEIEKEAEAQVAALNLTVDDFGDIDKYLKGEVDSLPEDKTVEEMLAWKPPKSKPNETSVLEELTGIDHDTMRELDEAYDIVNAPDEDFPNLAPVEYVGMDGDLSHLDDETLEELDEVHAEIEESAYNVTKYLLYELNFNVSNLMMAACKRCPEEPVIMAHWFPQLVVYKRYQHARDIDFEFTWDHVEAADESELERYWQGIGFKEPPKVNPWEASTIDMSYLDQDEDDDMAMFAMEEWLKEVYNPVIVRKDFDDDDITDEDNVFSPRYKIPEHPDDIPLANAKFDLDQWDREFGDESLLTEEELEYKHSMGRQEEIRVVDDPEFQKLFRGHLVVACTADDSDLEIAEKITKRCAEEFGKQVFVETRVMTHARKKDNCFEVWLESYEVELIHSKKRATDSADFDWEGPAECDDKQVEFIVERVGFLISDDMRNSHVYYDYIVYDR